MDAHRYLDVCIEFLNHELNLISCKWRKAESLEQKATTLMLCSELAVPLPVPNTGMMGKQHRTCRAFPFSCKISNAAQGWVSGLGFLIDLPDNCDGWHRHLKCVESQIFLPSHLTRTTPGVGWHNYHVTRENISHWTLGRNSFLGERRTEWIRQSLQYLNALIIYGY